MDVRGRWLTIVISLLLVALLVVIYVGEKNSRKKIITCPNRTKNERVVLKVDNFKFGEVVLGDVQTTLDQLDSIGYWNKDSVFDFRSIKNKLPVTSIEVNVVPINAPDEIKGVYYQQKAPTGETIIAVSTEVGSCVQRINIGLGAIVEKIPKNTVTRQLSSAFWNAIYMSTKYKGLSPINGDDRDNYVVERLKNGGSEVLVFSKK